MTSGTLPSSANHRSSLDELLQRARIDREAFGRLYDLTYPRIFRYCLRRLFVRTIAEDVTADVFLRVASHMKNFSGSAHDDFVRWVYRIATNQVNAHLRKTLRRRELLEAAARMKAFERSAADQAPHSVDDATPPWSDVYEELLTLKTRDQSIVALRFFEGLSHEQIAAVLELRPGAVRTALSRALRKIRARFEQPHDRTKN